MSYTYVAGAQNPANSVSITVVAGELVLVSANWNDDTSTPAAPTDGLGNTYTQVGLVRDSFDGVTTGLYQSLITTGGSAVIAFATNPTGMICLASRYTGLVGSSGVVSNFINGTLTNATNALTSTALTPGSQPGMLFGAGYVPSNQVLASGTGFTDRTTANVRNLLVEDAPIASLSAVAATFTYTAGATTRGIAIAAYFAEAGGGAPASYAMSSDMYF